MSPLLCKKASWDENLKHFLTFSSVKYGKEYYLRSDNFNSILSNVSIQQILWKTVKVVITGILNFKSLWKVSPVIVLLWIMRSKWSNKLKNLLNLENKIFTKKMRAIIASGLRVCNMLFTYLCKHDSWIGKNVITQHCFLLNFFYLHITHWQ